MDLRVMSPTSYQTALPRGGLSSIAYILRKTTILFCLVFEGDMEPSFARKLKRNLRLGHAIPWPIFKSYAPNKKALAVDSQGFFIIEVAGHGFEPWTFGL